MPLFACSKCDAVENTALSNYWLDRRAGAPVLCSECATGTWHGRFPKETARKGGWEPERPGSPFLTRKRQPLTPENNDGE